MADYIFLLETRLSQERQEILRKMRQSSRESGLNLYLTGGPMRDLLAGRPVGYLAFTTEGNPQALARKLAAEGAQQVDYDSVAQSLRADFMGVPIRVDAAKSEQGRPGGSILEDLRQRGLTLNSIGLSLNESSKGLLLDPTNGVADIETKLIRMNHSYVFFEDPVFLLRAVRLKTRLEFTIEERTEARMASAREGQYLEQAKPAALGRELEAIAYEPDPAAVLKALEKENLLEESFGRGFRTAKMEMEGLSQLDATIAGWRNIGVYASPGLVALPLILGGLAGADQVNLGKLLPTPHLAGRWKKLVADAAAVEKRVLAKKIKSPGELQDLVESSLPEAVALAVVSPVQSKAAKRLTDYQVFAQQQRQRLPLAQLRQLGMPPESAAGTEIIRLVLPRMMAGQLSSDAELSALVQAEVTARRPVVKPKPAPAPMTRHVAKLQKASAQLQKPEKAVVPAKTPQSGGRPQPATESTAAASGKRPIGGSLKTNPVPAKAAHPPASTAKVLTKPKTPSPALKPGKVAIKSAPKHAAPVKAAAKKKSSPVRKAPKPGKRKR